jgi:flagellar biosynthesis chaperone FliJ
VLRRMSDASISEVEHLINQLQKLRTRLQNASNRIQTDISEYGELSQQTMQLTSIIVDSVRKLPPPR